MFKSFTQSDSIAPPLSLLFGEARVVQDWTRGLKHNAGLARGRDGRGHLVVLLPGFMVSDERMRLLKRTLRQAGYAAHGWALGRNLGVTPDMLQRLDARVSELARRHGQPVTLIGWSLGGLIAREYAKLAPQNIARVVTLGSPFSGSIRANNAWRLYQWVAGHAVDAPPIEARLAEKPPVPTYALWSRRDGVVAPASARGEDGERDAAIEVDCLHMGFACAPEATKAILDLLEDQPASAEAGMAFAS